jgi:predicted outer membrane protein
MGNRQFWRTERPAVEVHTAVQQQAEYHRAELKEAQRSDDVYAFQDVATHQRRLEKFERWLRFLESLEMDTVLVLDMEDFEELGL